jgi:hypothetical protein
LGLETSGDKLMPVEVGTDGKWDEGSHVPCS